MMKLRYDWGGNEFGLFINGRLVEQRDVRITHVPDRKLVVQSQSSQFVEWLVPPDVVFGFLTLGMEQNAIIDPPTEWGSDIPGMTDLGGVKQVLVWVSPDSVMFVANDKGSKKLSRYVNAPHDVVLTN